MGGRGVVKANKNSYSANLTCSENYATALNNPFFGKIYLFYFVLINWIQNVFYFSSLGNHGHGELGSSF